MKKIFGRSFWVLLVWGVLSYAWGVAVGKGVLDRTTPKLKFSNKPNVGLYHPTGDGTCLIAVVGDNPGNWYYKVWRDTNAPPIEGKGPVVIP